MNLQQKMGTVDLPPSSNLQEDHKELRNALRGLTCNEKKVIEILGRRTKAQRESISERYKLVFGESLQKRVKSAMSNKLLARSVCLWLMEPSERDAVLLCEALKEVTPKKDRVVIGILCSRTSAQIYQIKQAFYTLFNQTLENHVDGSAFDFSELQAKSKWAFWRTSSEPKAKDPPKRAFGITKLLLALARGSRPVNTTIDRHIALTDAHQLNKVCIGKLGNEETLVRIFSTRSSYQLTATMNYYQQHYGHDFEKPLSKKDAGEFLQALRSVVRCLRQPSKFYAQELSTALSGSGSTDEETLIGIITTRAEVDLQVIKLEFQNECKKSLEEAIGTETSGTFRQFLLAVINQGDKLPSPRTSPASSDYMSVHTSIGSRQHASDSSQNGSASYFSGSVGSNSQNSF